MDLLTGLLIGATVGYAVGATFALNVAWHRHGWRPSEGR